jgi:NAD+ diphosphatase
VYKTYVPAVTAEENGENELTYWFVFRENNILLQCSQDHRWGVPLAIALAEFDISARRIQYLGKLEGRPCYSAEALPDAVAPEGMRFRELRSIFDDVEESVFLLAGKAIQIVRWDQDNQYCGKCGSAAETQKTERAKKCPDCGQVRYPQLSPAIIVAVIRDDQILLAHSVNFAAGVYSILAGFAEPGETLEECVQREVWEEVKIRVKNIRYFGSQPWPFPNSLMIGFTAEYESGEIQPDGVEIEEAAWFKAAALPLTPKKMSIGGRMVAWFVENYGE